MEPDLGRGHATADGHRPLRSLCLPPGSLRVDLDLASLSRADVPEAQDFRLWKLQNLLTPAECATLITETENVGYEDISWEYDKVDIRSHSSTHLTSHRTTAIVDVSSCLALR